MSFRARSAAVDSQIILDIAISDVQQVATPT